MRRRVVAVPLVSSDVLICCAVALVVAAIAFAASGGTQLARTTYTEIALMLGGAALVAVALVAPPAGAWRLHGGWTLAGLAGLTALTALSITWSLAPAETWVEANRLFSYLAAFAGALALAHMAPERWPSVLGGVALGCVVVTVWALMTKVFPSALSPDETFARLRAPYDYWNAVGLMAALGIAPLLWLAAKRSGNQALNALAYPGLGLSIVCLLLSYSRGALLALGVGLVFWLAVVPLRLRGATALLVAGAAAALIVAWAFSREGLTTDELPLSLRVDAGHELGLGLALMTVTLLCCGLAIGFSAANHPPGPRVRRRVGLGLVGLLLLAPVVGLVVLASKEGGISGQLSGAWRGATDPRAATPSNGPERLTAASSVRSRYWREAIDIWQAHEAVGTGAGSFPVARTRYRSGALEVRQAHGYVVETLVGLGLVGFLVTLALLAVWLASAARATGLRPADRREPMDAERVGLLTFVAVVVVFGVHSLVDWTWLIPGTAVVGLLCAAWVAGRGPLRARADRAGTRAVVAMRPGRRPVLRFLAARPARGGALRLLAAVAVLVLAVVASWAAFQPLRAVHAGDAAFERLDAGAPRAALHIAGIAVRRNPLSVEPLFDLAAIQSATGDVAGATRTYERAVELQPANAETWRRLGTYRAIDLRQPRTAVGPLRAAYYLDPKSAEVEAAFLLLQRQLAATPAP